RQFYYGKTKLMAEKSLLDRAEKGPAAIILRPRAVYGRYDNTIVPRILQLSKKKNIPLINNGNAMVDITYVGNLTGAVKNCLFAPDKAWNEVYNISNNDPVSVREWFGLILKIFNRPFYPKNIPEPVAIAMAGMMEVFSRLPFGNKKPSMTRFSVGYMARSMTMCIEKAAQGLNYSPRISNRQGFEKYKLWLETTRGHKSSYS
ncbi:MAG: NAD-dependent epimerase/dehydratase family protein, partial [Proteobacteria bacterium]|nr:NAD-dependent epimerase/dehydratase family protein [Pseudomonadota bacterium]